MPAPDKVSRDISPDIQSDLQLIYDAAREAGQIAMGYFGENPQVWMKKGNSPVSEADHAADEYLRRTLLAARPEYGWLSEESADDGERLNRKRVFIVDPIDGTRGFIAGNNKWCVSVAIVEQGRPCCGVLECPALEETYKVAKGCGSWLNGKKLDVGSIRQTRLMAGPKPLIRRHASETGIDFVSAPFIPSLAYRLAMVANGTLCGAYAKADCHDWDIAAVDLVLAEAGASLVELDGNPVEYNCPKITHGILIAAANGAIEPMRHAAQLESVSWDNN